MIVRVGRLAKKVLVTWFQLPTLFLLLLTLVPLGVAASGVSYSQLYADAEKLLQRRESKKALPLYRTLVRLRPNSSDARAGLGWILFDLGQKEEGIKEVKRAIVLNQKNADAHHHLAVIYLQLNRMQEAADEFRREFAINPKRDCNCGPIKSILAAYPANKEVKSKAAPQENAQSAEGAQKL